MYALLLAPSANRVYGESVHAMARAELGVLAESGLPGLPRIDGIDTEVIGGVPYLVFRAERMDAESARVLGRLSSAYALFERHPAAGSDGAELLAPVELPSSDRFDEDLITIPKYAGKTNEQFTKLLVNVTAFAAAAGTDGADTKGPANTAGADRPDAPGEPFSAQRFRLFDPVCGRGTTMNQALMFGWDSAGMDVDGKDFDAYRAHLESWTRRKRLKHHTEVTPVRREKKLLGRRLELDLAPSKDEYKRGETTQVAMVHADTLRAGDFFRPRSFDLLVADLPYGVRHGSRSGGAGSSSGARPGGASGKADSGGARGSASSGSELSRRPLDLLRRALPVWVRLLRPGAAVGLAWNTYVADRASVADAVRSAGLAVLEGGPYEQFAHRVDQAIHRDLIIARTPR